MVVKGVWMFHLNEIKEKYPVKIILLEKSNLKGTLTYY